jgi:hypothetical protein
MENYDANIKDFAEYKHLLLFEKKMFQEAVRNLFTSNNSMN